MPSAWFIEPWITRLLTIELIACCTVIAYTDFQRLIIPNLVNAALLVGGLVFRILNGLAAVAMACLAVVAIASSLWLLREIHFRLTGRIGLGLGDVKLMGAATPWLSVETFPVFIFLASFLALLFALLSTTRQQLWLQRRIPFGPFLACSLLLTWLFHNRLISLLGFL